MNLGVVQPKNSLHSQIKVGKPETGTKHSRNINAQNAAINTTVSVS